MTTTEFGFRIPSNHEKFSVDYWEGHALKDGGPYTLYPDYNDSTTNFARSQAINAIRVGGKPQEAIAVFELGTFFDTTQFNPGTVLRIEQESLVGPLDEKMLLFERVFWGVICESRDRDPKLQRLIIGFNEFTSDNRTHINFDHSEEPFPVSFRVGEVWRDSFDREDQIDELRKVTKVEVMIPGVRKKRKIKKGILEKIRIPGLNPLPIPQA